MRYIIVDLEATCWETGHTPARMEIIEIGAVELAACSGPVLDEFAMFVQPVVERKLSAFCQGLTSIRQEDVDPADPFGVVFPRFLGWIGAAPFVLCSWGFYDLSQFALDCERHGLTLPTTFERHINLKQEFGRLRRVKPCGMGKALEIAGIPLAGTHHRAIDDARNITKLALLVLPQLEEQGAIPAA